MATRINFIEVYEPSSDAELKVVEFLLEDYDIACALKPPDPRAAVPGDGYGKTVAVEEDKVGKAREVISDAVRTGVLSGEGRFVA